MPARQSVGSGGQPTPKIKKIKRTPTPRASVPSKSLPGARKANKTYGPGPVTVYTTPAAVPKTTRRAIRATNSAVGAKVLKPVRKRVKADIVVRASTGARFARQGISGAGGAGAPAGFNGNVKGQVAVSRGWARMKGGAQARAKQHELGHALGLAHPGSKKDPYVGLGPKRRIAGGGVMGSAPEINRSEVRRIRRLRGLRALASTSAAPKRRVSKNVATKKR